MNKRIQKNFRRISRKNFRRISQKNFTEEFHRCILQNNTIDKVHMR